MSSDELFELVAGQGFLLQEPVALSFLTPHLLNLLTESLQQGVMAWVISEKPVDFMKKPDSRLASFDGVGPDAVVSAVFEPVSDGFRGDGEVVG